MKKITDSIEEVVKSAFKNAGYEESYGTVQISNRPDLCQYQCNGAMSAAKAYHKAPFMIADDVVALLKDDSMFESVESVKPGFINITLAPAYISEYVKGMAEDDNLGFEKTSNPKKIVIDYGGPNVAKPLHVGHLRAAIIGESIKRILKYTGNSVIGDVHLGDWGLQIGLIITELEVRKPELPYFDEAYEGDYPTEAPFTMEELEQIYPYASGFSKQNPEYLAKAGQATADLQNGRRGYRALWQHIIDVSVADIKKNYEKLNVEFDLWKKESDAQEYIPDMVKMMKEKGYAYESDGALVVDVKQPEDKKEIPPCIILKSNGATNYETTDLATIIERIKLFNAEEIIYVVDKRQELHFDQVFRCARKTGLVNDDTDLVFIGFGTMNGKDGKPFKTRDGGVLRLETLIKEINDAVYARIMENREMEEEEARSIAATVGLSALKYGDLSNQASKDYVFDVDRFVSFEGNTGPYVLYSIVRIKSVLNKFVNEGGSLAKTNIIEPANESETNVMLQLLRYNEVIMQAATDKAPHKICQYIYELSDAFNSFYHGNKILSEENEERKNSWIALVILVKRVLEQCIDLLGFDAPEKM
ncbi:MAG: arginine--tRNA ligase [Lachnospiraceae bacterium]|nr:arginine--tRNA ligase [Lachnospiraceae bacterium]